MERRWLRLAIIDASEKNTVVNEAARSGPWRSWNRAKTVGLEVVHEENLRHHYALTLRDWCRNLVDHWDEAVGEVGLPTAKVWGLYMAGSRLGFETNVVQVHQVLAVKLDSHAVLRCGPGGRARSGCLKTHP
jgi:hypothetical protein